MFTYSTESTQKSMDPEVLDDFKERQAKMNNIQSAMQSGDIKSGYVLCIALHCLALGFGFLIIWPSSLSALLSGDDDSKTVASSATKTQPNPAQNRNRNNKTKRR